MPHGRPGEPPAHPGSTACVPAETYSLFRRVERPILHDQRGWRRRTAEEEDIARMAEQREDALNGGGEVLVRLDEEIAFDGVSRGIP